MDALWRISLTLLFFMSFSFGCGSNQEEVLSNNPPLSSFSSLPAKWNASVLAKSGPLKIALSQDLVDQFEEPLEGEMSIRHIIEEMALQWDESLPWLKFFNFPFSKVSNPDFTSLDDFYDDEIGIYNSKTWFPDVSFDALAITQYFGYQQGDHLEIIHADIIINDKYFDFSVDPLDYGKFDLPSIVLHELGHLIGLPHRYSFESVMRPNLASNEVEWFLYLSDINEIQSKYPSVLLPLGFSSAFSYSDQPAPGILQRIVIELRADGHCSSFTEEF